MADVRLVQLSKSYGQQSILRTIDLHIQDGEFMVFVGPSGCGKSTLLRMIAGLEDITEGELQIGGQRANDLPPAKRGLAMVFQSYALYPHMTVFDNMAFGLSLSKMPKATIKETVNKAAQALQITHLLERKPRDLSGGQRQRVAIGRAIVRQPQLFLFDEPLSNLDASLRVQMRIELSKLHKQLKSTMIYVTHDQVEAMTLGQRIAVFHGGIIEQVGTPLELYEHPANLFVAGFLGSPKMNFLNATVVSSDAQELRVQLADGHQLRLAICAPELAPSSPVTIGVRAEHLLLAAGADEENSFPAQIHLIEHLGDASIAYLQVAGATEMLAARLAAGQNRIQTGQTEYFRFAAEHAYAFDVTGKALPRLSASNR